MICELLRKDARRYRIRCSQIIENRDILRFETIFFENILFLCVECMGK